MANEKAETLSLWKVVVPAIVTGLTSMYIAKVNADTDYKKAALGYQNLVQNYDQVSKNLEQVNSKVELLSKIALKTTPVVTAAVAVAADPTAQPLPIGTRTLTPLVRTPAPLLQPPATLFKTDERQALNTSVAELQKAHSEPRLAALKRLPKSLDDYAP